MAVAPPSGNRRATAAVVIFAAWVRRTERPQPVDGGDDRDVPLDQDEWRRRDHGMSVGRAHESHGGPLRDRMVRPHPSVERR
jgi:hypothetical protein